MIKRKSTEVVHLLYDFYPAELFNNQQEEADYITSAIKKLVHKGHFLNGGLDEQVSPDNLRQWGGIILMKVYIGTYQQPYPPCNQGALYICLQACCEIGPSCYWT